MDWFRWWHGTASDSKFSTIAKRVNVHKTVVISVWVVLLEYASQCKLRGSLTGIDYDDIANSLEVDKDKIELICNAMIDKKILHVTKCNKRETKCNSDVTLKIANWKKRQPKREDNSSERVKKHRNNAASRNSENKKIKNDVTQCNASVTQCNASVTQCNASVTPQSRAEQSREDNNNTNVITIEFKDSEKDDNDIYLKFCSRRFSNFVPSPQNRIWEIFGKWRKAGVSELDLENALEYALKTSNGVSTPHYLENIALRYAQNRKSPGSAPMGFKTREEKIAEQNEETARRFLAGGA
jgi:hypothetical protein